MEKCAVCGVDAKQKCAGCNLIFYCSREHQVIDWKKAHKKSCKCFEFESNDILGRYMIAKRDIKPGEIILKEKPMIIGPKTISHPICLGCHKSLIPIENDYYKCSKCTWPLCGKSCENSEYHKDECKLYCEKNFKSSIKFCESAKAESSYCVIMPIRALLLKKSKPKVYEEFSKLVSHLEQRISTKLYEALRINLAQFITNFIQFPNVTEKEILNIAGRFDTNCFEVILPSKKIKARGIYLETAMMAHECVPNTKHFVDENFEMRVFATIPIAKGQKILTSYTHPLKTTIERRLGIKQAKCFDCICTRCIDPTEMSTFASSIKCTACNNGVLTSIDPLENLSDWKCTNCSQKMPGMKVFQVLNEIKIKMENLNKKSVQDCEKFLNDHEHILPNGSVFVVDVKYALCLLYGNVDGFLFKDLSQVQIERKMKLCEEMIKLLSIFEPGISNSVLNTQFELEACKIVLKRNDSSKEKLLKVYNQLITSSEGKSLLETRLKRIPI
ncbi:hypothetical protein PVAND_013281 [Polypedilum vanderplanki]|uniref:Protein msta n=1 Tax=Polypedilum vanderplanki TaxID=319348 RepID=A0A9J6CQ67_POLVA|nr:hypothetical protein PVAND_013281 [Polypedilum vanderplanki]